MRPVHTTAILFLMICLSLPLPVACLAGLVLVAAPALAGKPRVEVKKKVSIAQRAKPPTFSSVGRTSLMDRGRLVYLGRGLFAEQDRFFFLDTRSMETIEVRAPITRFLEEHPEQFPGAEGAGWMRYASDHLVFYDTEDGRAGILYGDNRGKQRRLFCLVWDLKAKRIVRADPLGTRVLGSRWAGAKRIGYDTERGEGLVRVHVMEMVGEKRPGTVRVVGIGKEKARVIARVELGRNLRDPPYFDPAGRRVMLTEYAELPVEGAPPVGHLVQLDTGEVTACRIPVTPYGFAYGPAGKSLYAYSNQAGELWRIDAQSGKRIQQAKLAKRGHALGFVAPGRLLMLNHKGFHFLDAETLKRKAFVPYDVIAKGYWHVEGSFIVPGRAYIENGQDFLIVDLPDIP